MATKGMKKADVKLKEAQQLAKIKSVKSVTDQVKNQTKRSAQIQIVDDRRKCFLTVQNWNVINILTGKQMMIRKGQLVILIAEANKGNWNGRSFSTLDGRMFTHLPYPENRDTCFLRPIFKESPLIWSDRV